MDLNGILTELGAVDEQLIGAAGHESDALGGLLDQRALLIEQAAATLGALHSVTAEQRQALARSERAGNALVRQLILVKHVLSSEIRQLEQEQRLWGAIRAVDSGQRSYQLDISG